MGSQVRVLLRPPTRKSLEHGPSLAGNWTMWFHDPEGIRIEVHQYGPEAYQIYGRKDR